MTHNELLQLGCEVAGLNEVNAEDALILGKYEGWTAPKWQGIVLPCQHPALPTYVASLLVEQCSERFVNYLLTLHAPTWSAPPNERIAAALVDLGHITLEQAQEALRENSSSERQASHDSNEKSEA